MSPRIEAANAHDDRRDVRGERRLLGHGAEDVLSLLDGTQLHAQQLANGRGRAARFEEETVGVGGDREPTRAEPRDDSGIGRLGLAERVAELRGREPSVVAR